METSKTKKMSVVLSVAALSVVCSLLVPDKYYTAMIENDLTTQIKNKLEAYTRHLPEERIYLQLDKPFYEPGDDIWFSAYLRNGSDLKPSGQSEILYAELIGPK